jgi:2',3'-cyclic-nucleotide 2'-phosphodiesterase (5'-nucleotidase family)
VLKNDAIDIVMRLPRVVCTNFDTRQSPDLAARIATSRILVTRSGLRVAVIVLYGWTYEDQTKLSGLTLLNPYASAAREIAEVIERDGAQIVIVVAKSMDGVDNAVSLAKYKDFLGEIGKVSIFVSDLDLPEDPALNVISATGVVGPAARIGHVSCPNSECLQGLRVAHAEVSFDADGHVLSASTALVNVNGSVPAAPRVSAILDPIRDRILDVLLAPYARTEISLVGDRSVCRLRDCSLGHLLGDAMVDFLARGRDGPASLAFLGKIAGIWGATANTTGISSVPRPVALTNAGFIRNSIARGNLTRMAMQISFPFPNLIAYGNVSGATLLAAVKRSFEDFAVLNATKDGDGAFLQVSNIRIYFQPESEQVNQVEVVHEDGQWRPLQFYGMYPIVLPDWISRGGDGYGMLLGHNWTVTEVLVSHAFFIYTEDLGVVPAALGQRSLIRFEAANSEYRLKCPSGHVQPDSDFACQKCDINKFKLSEIKCEPCPEAQTSEAGSDSCTLPRRVETITVSKNAIRAVIILAALFLAACVVSGALLWSRRTVPIMKRSSPVFNYLVVFGCLLGGLAVVVLPIASSAACMAWVWLLVLSFTIVFGALFVKAYRVSGFFILFFLFFLF